MNATSPLWRLLCDPRLNGHAAGPLPAWLWTIDGARLIWTNPPAALMFGASTAELSRHEFGPADQRRRQIARLAARLTPNGPPRLERLQNFGASLGGLLTCGCARLVLADGEEAILIAAAQTSGRTMSLAERMQRLIADAPDPLATFAADGRFLAATPSAMEVFADGSRVSAGLSVLGLDAARDAALRDGQADSTAYIGDIKLLRIGEGVDVALLAWITARVAAETSVNQDNAAQADDPAEPSPDDDLVVPETVEAALPALAGVEGASEVPETIATPPAEPDSVLQNPADVPSTPSATSFLPEPPSPATMRRHPLRFVWQMDSETRLAIGSDEFTRLIGIHTAASFGRQWSDIAAAYNLDSDGRVAEAIARHDTWSGVTVLWPVDGLQSRLPVELSALPVFDRNGVFAGYRGFGVCRDLDGLTRLAAQRRHDALYGYVPAPPPAELVDPPPGIGAQNDGAANHDTLVSSEATEVLPVTSSENVLQFPLLPDPRQSEPKPPALTAVESNAFNELARQLAARLESERTVPDDAVAGADVTATAPEAADSSDEPEDGDDRPSEPPAPWLAAPQIPPRVASQRDTLLFDRLSIGILVYRLDRLIYANRAFLDGVGHASLHALADAGGLDALLVEPVMSGASSTSDAGTPVTIAATSGAQATSARLYAISWDNDDAMALVFDAPQMPPQPVAAQQATETPAGDHADAEELGAILDTAAEGILMFDAHGKVLSCNPSAEALFDHDGKDIASRNLIDLFAAESQHVVRTYLNSVQDSGFASLMGHGRDVLGRARDGSFIPLAVTIGRTRSGGPRFFAILRDLTHAKKNETDLIVARRQADRAANAKVDVLARISHDIRTPLNAIIGFADVMIEERFGALNERYIAYMRDIRASGERVLAIVGDLHDLSRIETGQFGLEIAPLDLNDLVEQCVGIMQPQANRERIIIRSSLAHALPRVTADAGSLRQIVLNLIGSAIRLANAGGQVIVSTALTDFGETALRIRDTGKGLSDSELQTALDSVHAPSAEDASSPGINFSLTKALVEANRAQFHIRSAPQAGTLIEIVFAAATAPAA